MKYAIALVAGLAILASVHAAPAAETDLYFSDAFRDIIAACRGRVQDKIEELNRAREDLLRRIGEAKDFAKDQLKESLDQLTNDLRNNLNQLLEGLNKGIRKNDESYFKDAIIEKIREYREKAKEILSRVSVIVKEEAVAIGKEAKCRFEEQKQNLIDQVNKINDQIKKAVNEAINGKQENVETNEVEVYALETIKSKIRDITAKMQELTKKAKESAGEKKDDIMKQLGEVKKELAEAVKDFRNAIRDIFGKEPLTYSMAAQEADVYFLQTIKDLRAKLNQKLAELKEYAEMIKAAHGMITEQVKLGFETLKDEARNLKEQIITKVKEELNKPHAE